MLTKPRLLLSVTLGAACVVGLALLLLLPPGASRLVEAARDGDAARVGALLAEGADPNAVLTESSPTAFFLSGKARLRTTPLLEAVRQDHGAIVRLLLDAGADPEFVPEADALPPLFVAVQRASPEVVSMLIEAGASVRRPVHVDGSPVFVWAAAKPGLLPKLVRCARAIDPAQDRDLIREAIELRTRSERQGEIRSNPLIDRYLAELLRQRDAPPDDLLAQIRLRGDRSLATAPGVVRPDSAWTALTWAIVNERSELVDAMLAERGQAGDATAWGMTPLMAAAAVGDPGLVTRLLGLGADPGAADETGRKPYEYAGGPDKEAVLEPLRR
ncbi:MAG: ankyrin repeat domain-containing protein [Phycisphaerales bacterium]|nr:ankyrin repeat domain-containing protein [Phycisphaerales bacterium]